MQLPRGLARKLPGVAVSSQASALLAVPMPPAAAAGAPAARDRARAIAAAAAAPPPPSSPRRRRRRRRFGARMQSPQHSTGRFVENYVVGELKW
jgi:hypothetical protein